MSLIAIGSTVIGSLSRMTRSASFPASSVPFRSCSPYCDMAGVNSAAHKEWTLTKLNGKAIEAAKRPTMLFSHGKLSVFGGVNQLTGSYALVRNTVTMSDLASTKMAGPPDLMELETNFAEMLRSVDSFKVAGNELMLLTEGNTVAVFHSSK